MLQDIRDRFTGPTALIVLGLIAIPFIFVGVSSPLLSAGFAAKVNGDEISMPVFENAWQNQVTQNPEILNYPPVYLNALRQQMLDQLIDERLIAAYLNDTGMRIADRMVTDRVQQESAFQVDGKFSIDEYKNTLSLQGRNPTEFEATVKQRLREFQLQRAIAGTAFVAPSEYRRYLNLFAEQRQVTIATIPVADIQDAIEITEDEVLEFYDSRSDQFMTDETVDLEFIEIRRDSLADNALIDAADLQQYYEDSTNRYLQDERRQARHIMIPFGDDEAAAREQAIALTARVQAGEPFDDLARQYSKDGMTSNRGGDLGLIPHSQMPDALGDSIFSMRKGEVTGPVRTDFGFHIVRLDDIVEGGPLPLDQVRAELERELRDRQADLEFRNLENALTTALFDAVEMQAIAESVGLALQTTAGFTRSAGGDPFGANQAVIDAVFDERVLNDGEISDIIEIDANRSAIVSVAEHHPAELESLDDVREQIVGALKSARAQEVIAERSEQLQERLRAGDDILTAAESVGASVGPVTVVSRTDENMDARLLAAIFRSKKPQGTSPRIGGAVTQDGNYAVFSLMASSPGRPESIPLADRDTRKQELAAQSGSADLAAFLGELNQRADIVKSDDVMIADDNY